MKKYSLDIVGCTGAKEYLLSALEGGYVSHAYIVEGAFGTGRHRLVRELIKAMACENDTAPCGRCGSCIKIDAGVCVDIYRIKTAEGKSELTVDLIRGIYDTLGLMPNDLPFKAYIIDDGEKMNTYAQNAFLKMFEEPPSNVYFFLITSDASKLLPTVRSRALVLRTEKLNREQINSVLDREGVPDDAKRKAAVELADGSAGEAIRIYNDDAESVNVRAVSDKLVEALFSPGSDKLGFINLHHKNIRKTDELCRVYTLVQRAVRDIMLYRAGAENELLYFSSSEALEEMSLRVSDKAVMRVNDVIDELLQLADTPLNPALTMTEFASRIWDCHLL